MSAVISACGQYRYLLTRPSELEHPTSGPAVFVMLNPSTADASIDDPTIRRCRAFAKIWGCAGIKVVNLYAYRSPSPKIMFSCADPVGPENDTLLSSISTRHKDIVLACGANAEFGRLIDVANIFQNAGCRLFCFGATKNGFPRHPLYVKGDTQLIQFEFKEYR